MVGRTTASQTFPIAQFHLSAVNRDYYPLGADLAVGKTTFLRAKELEMSISSQTAGEQEAETSGEGRRQLHRRGYPGELRDLEFNLPGRRRDRFKG